MRLRIIVNKNEDPARDLEIAADFRRDLWAHSPVEYDLDDPSVKTRRTVDTHTAYFEFDTEFPDEVARIVREYNYTERLRVEELTPDQQTAGI